MGGKTDVVKGRIKEAAARWGPKSPQPVASWREGPPATPSHVGQPFLAWPCRCLLTPAGPVCYSEVGPP